MIFDLLVFATDLVFLLPLLVVNMTNEKLYLISGILKWKPEPRGLFINRMDKTADQVAKHSKSISYLIMEVFHKMEMNYIITLKSEIIILTFWQRSQCNIWNHL